MMKKRFTSIIEFYSDIWNGFNLLGKIIFYPILIFLFPIAALVIFCMSDETG